jgi:hypothetical protein
MFDRMKHVVNWTTMVYHVYDHVYCKLITIAICNMWFEDTKVQQVIHGQSLMKQC